ncbi:MAG: 3-dehydroquinate synthase [Spirochaetales bacterium]|nr:3-dehydroquinate synthase [Spirochaetales bacterium]
MAKKASTQRGLTFRFGGKVCRVNFLSPEQVILPGEKGLFVFDENVLPLIKNKPDPAPGTAVLTLKSGELSKNWDNLKLILQTAREAGLGRDSFFYALGGGVVCDLTALGASLYMRGTGLILIPTTLLAMVDAGLGGKTGIDLDGYKNLVGTFYPAGELRIAAGFLADLPEREFQSGLAELIKHGFLRSSSLLPSLRSCRSALLHRDPEILTWAVRESLKIKGYYVTRDFNETSLRTHLNFGHTFAHALETSRGLAGISHGEAVAWGMARSLEAGVLMGLTKPAWEHRAKSLLEDFGLDLSLGGDGAAETLLPLMKEDKKKKDGRVRFVLQRDWGRTILREIPDTILRRVLSPGF